MATTLRTLIVLLLLLRQVWGCWCWIHGGASSSCPPNRACPSLRNEDITRRLSAFVVCLHMANHQGNERASRLGWESWNDWRHRCRRIRRCRSVITVLATAMAVQASTSNSSEGAFDSNPEFEPDRFSEDDSEEEELGAYARRAQSSISSVDSFMYDDRWPRRVATPSAPARALASVWAAGHRHPSFPSTSSSVSWGVHRSSAPSLPVFPSTVDALAEDAASAIRAVLPDRATSSTVPRPQSRGSDRLRRWDAPRIGLELDGVARLFPRHDPSSRDDSESAALREVCLVLASKLGANQHNASNADVEYRPSWTSVALYVNTVAQALQASLQLRRLRRSEEGTGERRRSEWGCITVHCLGESPDGLPAPASEIDGGIVLIVQPTDYNAEYRPPGPAVGAVEALQRLTARSWALGRPTIVVSPRFGSTAVANAMVGSNAVGTHSPPWIVRDFCPPAFSWIAGGLSLEAGERRPRWPPPGEHGRRYLAVNLLQRGPTDGAWHLFASYAPEEEDDRQCKYEYLASTACAAGRPTRSALRHLFAEFASHSREPM